MSNHLGNVLTVINDIKVPQATNSVDVDGYLATIVSTADYSPFGVQLDGRTVSAESYRYGYQGSEKDDEVKGSGNSYTTEFRQLNPRLGRWLSIDPLAGKFPWQSPYVSMDNCPINLSDASGLSTDGEPKEGETCTNEDGSQEVFLGIGENQGWKDVKEVNSFQSISGDAVFVRIGDYGSHEYKRIENVVISIGSELKNSRTSEKSEILNDNTWIIVVEDIEEAAKLYKDRFGNAKVGSMVMDTHGSGSYRRDYAGKVWLSGFETTIGNETPRLTKYGMEAAYSGIRFKAISIEEYNDAVAFNFLVSRVSSGGVLIMTGCTTGNDSKTIGSIAKITASDVKIYSNMDLTLCERTSNNIIITTDEKFYKKGWVLYDRKYKILSQNKTFKF